MPTRTFRAWVETDRVGSMSSYDFEVDVEEGEELSDEEIEEHAREAIWNVASWGWEEVE